MVGESRTYLRAVLGPVPVLFFNGCQGDISVRNQASPFRDGETRDQSCARAAHLLSGETLRLLHHADWRKDADLAIMADVFRSGVRLPSKERLKWAKEILERVENGEGQTAWDIMFAFQIAKLHNEFSRNPELELNLRVVRVGDAVIATQPSELYCQFGLDVKRRSPFKHTVVCGLSNGNAGYCPTSYSIIGGGYSGEPIYSCKMEEKTGYRLVDKLCRMLNQLNPDLLE